jgi:hypothetical protein
MPNVETEPEALTALLAELVGRALVVPQVAQTAASFAP